MPGRSCADILKRRCDELKDGVYWVRLGAKSMYGSGELSTPMLVVILFYI